MGRIQSYFVCFSVWVAFTSAAFREYDDLTLSKGQEAMIFSKFGMFSKSDTPAGSDSPYIELEANFSSRTESDGKIDVLIYHSSEENVGYFSKADDEHHLCCTPDLNITCDVGSIIAPENNSATFWKETLQFSPQVPTNYVKKKFDIVKTGLYYMIFLNCNSSEIAITGESDFKNPFGFLPGEDWYYLPFYGSMALISLVMCVMWGITMLCYRKELLRLQYWIGFVMVLQTVECATLYFDYLGYNNLGNNYVAAMIMGVITSSVKRTLSRVLVLGVSLGYGVVLPALGSTTKYKLIALALCYFVFSFALEVVKIATRTNSAAEEAVKLMLIWPVAILDTIFYWWILLSLFRTIKLLKLRKQPIKLTMYKQFFAILIAACVMSLLLIISQILYVTARDATQRWQVEWVWEALWLVVYVFVMGAISVIWRPTTNNTRYAYSELADTLGGDDENSFPLSKQAVSQNFGTEVTLRDSSPSNTPASTTKPESVSPVVFSITDEVPESERSKLE